MSKLLVVDWDFFFEAKERDPDQWTLFDWGHRESLFFIEGPLWAMRAAGFLRNNLPLPSTTGEEEDFWDRFDIHPNADLFVAESNAFAARTDVQYGVDEVWLYDAHHDSCYSGPDTNVQPILDKGLYSCEDWMLLYAAACRHTPQMRYPTWRSWALEGEPEPPVEVDRQVDDPSNRPSVTFDKVFICRSGAWTPPWIDSRFIDFVMECPTATHPVDLGAEQYGCMRVRPFELEEADQWVERSDALSRLADK